MPAVFLYLSVLNSCFSCCCLDFVVRINWSCRWMGEHIASWRWESVWKRPSECTMCWRCWSEYTSFGNCLSVTSLRVYLSVQWCFLSRAVSKQNQCCPHCGNNYLMGIWSLKSQQRTPVTPTARKAEFVTCQLSADVGGRVDWVVMIDSVPKSKSQLGRHYHVPSYSVIPSVQALF